LVGVDPRLAVIAGRALGKTPIDFVIIDGVRTEAEQREMVRTGASKTMNSKHLTGRAIDIMAWLNGKGRWEPELYQRIWPAFEAAAGELGLELVWGGSWGWDWGHIELK
jgi:peptidoglycan L-alanyl-D-glutamate endopeptidase CwlK